MDWLKIRRRPAPLVKFNIKLNVKPQPRHVKHPDGAHQVLVQVHVGLEMSALDRQHRLVNDAKVADPRRDQHGHVVGKAAVAASRTDVFDLEAVELVGQEVDARVHGLFTTRNIEFIFFK